MKKELIYKNLKLTSEELDVLFTFISIQQGKLNRLKKLSKRQLKIKKDLEDLSLKIWNLQISE